MQRIHDDQFQAAFLRRFGVELMGFLMSFAMLVHGWGELNRSFWIGMGGFFLTSLVAGHRIKYFTYKYTCPQCGRKAERRPGNRVIFYCSDCDVEYITRMRDEGAAGSGAMQGSRNR